MSDTLLLAADRPSGGMLGFFKTIFRTNITLWDKLFWEAWDPLPWDAKFAWVYFITNTIALITIIEVLILR